jgi:hypothetical protein
MSQLCFIIKGIVAPSGAMATFDISLASGNKSTNGNGTTKNGGTIGNGGSTKGGGVRSSISMQGPLLAFIPVVDFFRKL